PRIRRGGVGGHRRRPIRGDRSPLGQGKQTRQNEVKRPALSPTENSGLGENGVDADQQKESRAAQAADQDIAVHRGPPCDSPRRRTTSQTPRPIRNTGQEYSIRRPWKISSCPRGKRVPRATS